MFDYHTEYEEMLDQIRHHKDAHVFPSYVIVSQELFNVFNFHGYLEPISGCSGYFNATGLKDLGSRGLEDGILFISTVDDIPEAELRS